MSCVCLPTIALSVALFPVSKYIDFIFTPVSLLLYESF